MDKQNIYGIKYEVNIDDLTSSTAEAGKKIRLANAEFNEASSRLDNWATSTEGVSAKLRQLNTILEAEKTKLANSQKAYNEKIDTINKYEKEIAELKQQKEQAIKQYGAESAEVKELTTKIKQLERSQDATTNSADKLKITITNQQASVNKTEKSIGKYEEQLDDLKEAQARAEKSGNSLEDELKDIRKASNDTEDSVDDLGDGFTTVKGAIAGFVANALTSMIQGLQNAIEETREYRMEMGKLEATAQTMGASFDKAKDNLKEVTAITDDTEAGVEGLNNLLAAGFDGSQLDAITDQLLGAAIKWKDTLKFEGLADGLQETLATGKAVGPFAEMLERSGVKLEKFDAGLAKATKSGKQQQYVLDYLAKYSLVDVKNAYEENNKTLVESAKASFEYQDTLAQLSKKTEPILTSIKKGFTGMLKDIVKATDDVDLSGLTDTIDGVFELIGKGTGFVVRNLDTILPVVKGLTTAWITYKSAVLLANGAEKAGNLIKALTATATTASTVATGANTTATVANSVATKGATVATKALAMAQKLTPWGAVAGLVVGVTTALVAFASKSKNTKDITDANTEAIKKLKEEYKELNDQLEQNKKSRDEAVASSTAEAVNAENLLGKLEKLSTVENKSNAQKKQMKYYVDSLNRIMPELNLKYDEEKDSLNKSTSAIRSNIKAQKELAMAKAYQKNLEGIAEDMAKTEMKLAEATEQHVDNEEQLAEAKKKTTEAYKAYTDAGSKYGSAEWQAWEKARTSQEKAQKNYDETKKTVNKLTGEMDGLNKEFDKTDKFAQNKLSSAEIEKSLDTLVQGAKKKGIEVPKAVSDGIREGKYALPQSIDEMKALVTFNDLAKKAKDSGISIPKNISDGVKSGKMTPSQAVKQMNNIVSFNDLLKKSNIAGKNVPEYLSKAVASGKMKPSQAVQQMKDLVKYNDLVSKAKKAGVDVPQKIKDGVASGKIKPKDAVAQVNALMVKEANAPKGKMKSAGASNISSVQSGMNSKKGSVTSSAKGISGDMVKSFNSHQKDFKSAGKHVTSGIDSGMGDGGSLVSKIGGWASSMVSTFKKKFDIHSPSRVMMKISKYIPEGVAKGIANNTKKATSTMVSLSNSMLKTFKKASNGKFESIGASVIKKYKTGMESQANSTIKSVENIVDKNIQALINKNKKSENLLLKRNKKLEYAKNKKGTSKKRKNELSVEIKKNKKLISELKKASSGYKKAGTALISSYSSSIKDGTKKAIKEVEKSVNKLAEKAQAQYNAIIEKRTALRDTLSNHGDLYTEDENGNIILGDLKKNAQEIGKYGKNLEKLKKTLPSSLMNEILGMDVKEGLKYTNALLSLSSKELDAYVAAYKQRENAAKTISNNYYKNEIANVKKSFETSVAAEMKTLSGKLKTIGKQTMSGFISGMNSKSKSLQNSAKTLANTVVKEFKKKFKPTTKKNKSKFQNTKSITVGAAARAAKTISKNKTKSKNKKSTVSKAAAGLAAKVKSVNNANLKLATAGALAGNNKAGNVNNVTFNQYNQSPKALDSLEIYRNTQKQMKQFEIWKGGK